MHCLWHSWQGHPRTLNLYALFKTGIWDYQSDFHFSVKLRVQHYFESVYFHRLAALLPLFLLHSSMTQFVTSGCIVVNTRGHSFISLC